ncbi:MAG: alpha/beta hydrolase [Phormidesmis sp.]
MALSSNFRKKSLLSIEKIPPASETFPAYFVGSTAPNNIEDGVGDVDDPKDEIEQIAKFLNQAQKPEILVVIHGYNTALGSFGPAGQSGGGEGTKGWYQDIRNHIAQKCDRRSPGLILIGYRWPSEQINGGGNDSLKSKLQYARQSLPIALQAIVAGSISVFAALVAASLAALFRLISFPAGARIAAIGVLVLATLFIALVFTLFLLRLVGYFRDSYRATHYGVPDLIELIRQLDKAVEASPYKAQRNWQKGHIKLSFIGHSMGGFVVTNTVRILSDVFSRKSIGSLALNDKSKNPSPDIGHVFSLGRLVLVSPDIPADTIISGRANFLSSSLRRFEETYLFSNEGDMALKLASTAANYASFPAKTREGGYRLGNVVVRSPDKAIYNNSSYSNSQYRPEYGIVNFDSTAADGGQMRDMTAREDGGIEPTRTLPKAQNSQSSAQTPAQSNQVPIPVSSFLKYLYTLDKTPLSERQQSLLEPEQKPIAELFTVFDCTDYSEFLPSRQGKPQKKVGLLTYSLKKRSLTFIDCAWLTIAMARGTIDTHGGYFYAGDLKPAKQQVPTPEAYVTKQLIYGLACLGFSPFLAALSTGIDEGLSPTATAKKELTTLSQLCETRNIQVLLAAERYNRDVLGIKDKCDRDGY